jgi:hypothetical protein
LGGSQSCFNIKNYFFPSPVLSWSYPLWLHHLIPLRAKRVGEFINNGHKTISPTRIGSGSGVTL